MAVVAVAEAVVGVVAVAVAAAAVVAVAAAAAAVVGYSLVEGRASTSQSDPVNC